MSDPQEARRAINTNRNSVASKMKRANKIIDEMSKLEGMKAYDSPNRRKQDNPKEIPGKVPKKDRIQI